MLPFSPQPGLEVDETEWCERGDFSEQFRSILSQGYLLLSAPSAQVSQILSNTKVGIIPVLKKKASTCG